MAIAHIENIKVKDLELVAYEVSKIMIDKGYYSDVKKSEDGYVTFIYKDRFLKEFIGTPTAIKCSFKQTDNAIDIEVKATHIEIKGKEIIKEVLGIATVLPSLNKMVEIPKMKKAVKQACLLAIDKFKEVK